MELGDQTEAAEVAQMRDGVGWGVAVEKEKLDRWP